VKNQQNAEFIDRTAEALNNAELLLQTLRKQFNENWIAY
jgi:hypothetical protein